MHERDKPHLNFVVVFAVAFISTILLWLYPYIVGHYVDNSCSYIPKKDMASELVGLQGSLPKGWRWCSAEYKTLGGKEISYINPVVEVFEFDHEIFGHARKIHRGGIWMPHMCKSKFEVALIVPYRNRSSQLNLFLSYMHPFLQNQQLFYRIFVIEQRNDRPFNRGKLFNIGFKEGRQLGPPKDCFIFHDVDLLPQNGANTYACTHNPRHMTSSVNSFRYHLPYRNLFGGAIAIGVQPFEEINGFSNKFDGWGGEDDNLAWRLKNKGLRFVRFEPSVASYVMMPHAKEVPAASRYRNIVEKVDEAEKNGLTNLSYQVLSVEYKSLYTHIAVTW